MGLQTYTVDFFRGVEQNLTENRLDPGWTADEMNMDTADGDLMVGCGYVRHIDAAVPGANRIRRMYIWHTLVEVDNEMVPKDLFVVATTRYVYYWNEEDNEWTQIYDHGKILSSTNWEFKEVRIGSQDYLLIANGEKQMVKWSGTGNATAFGTAQWIASALVIDAVSYNAAKAGTVSYSESANVGTFTLTNMPAGWSYSANCKIAWKVKRTPGTIYECKVVVGGNTHTLDYVPYMSSGDTIVVTLTSTTEATAGDEWEENKYGVTGFTLHEALDDDEQARVLAVGIMVGKNAKSAVSYEVDSIDNTGKVITLVKTAGAGDITTSRKAYIRGGISNKKVNFIEMYNSRLFTAGEADNPIRLYWSQPPGDTRSIEDWSADDASADTGGGYVDVGSPSDKIVGLTALSSQILIFKERSLWRLIGDRPSNFRIMQVNKDFDLTCNSSIIESGDVPYWMTKVGMYYFDGQTARVMPNARQIHNLVETAGLSVCKACKCLDRLYFTCNVGNFTYDNTIIVYDLRERKYLIRNGFSVADIFSYNGELYMVNYHRYVCRWDRNARTYDGAQIDAWWCTPFSDFGAMSVEKALRCLYLRGEGGTLKLDVKIGNMKQDHVRHMPPNLGDVIPIPLRRDVGRVIGMKIYNQEGSWFRVAGGVSLTYETSEDGDKHG